MIIKTITEAEYYALKYLQSDTVLKSEFYEENGLTRNDADKMIRILKRENPELFQKFLDFKNNPNPGRIKQEQEKYEQSKRDAERYALEYLNGDIVEKNEFYKSMNMNDGEIYKMLQILKRENHELYERFSNVKDNPNPGMIKKEQEEYEQGKIELDQILEGLLMGVDGRKFDVLDYFCITKRGSSDIVKIFSKTNYGEAERKLLYNFFNENTHVFNSNKYSKSQKIIKSQELDGKLILGGNEVSTEIKLEAMQFLEENQLPQFRSLYILKIKRIMEENNKKTSTQYCKKR